MTAVPALMPIPDGGHALGLQREEDPRAVLGHHVPVIPTMRHQGRGAHRSQIEQVVALGPERVPITALAVLLGEHELVAHIGIAPLAAHRIARVNEVIEHIDVFTDVATRVPHQTVAAVVVVVRRVGRDWDDRFQAFHTGGRCGQRQRAVVRGADHADLAGAPCGAHLVTAHGRGVALGATAQPIDHGLGCQRFVVATDGRATI